MEQRPPQSALKFLRWFCRPDYLEEIEGNLIELYEQQHAAAAGKAKRQFYWNVLLHFRPEYIRTFNSNPINTWGMYKNYLKIAWRSMLKQKLYTSINIAGLAVGLSCFILIFLYVQHELSYDRFYSNADQIYRVYQQQKGNNFLGSDYFAVTPAGLAGALKAECPEVSQATSIGERSVLLGGEKEHFFEKGLMADPNFFGVFPFPFLQGDAGRALQEPNSIVLTRSLAKKLFGDQEALGKTVDYQDQEPYTVTAVLEDPPTNISFKFSFVASIISADENYQEQIKSEKWRNNGIHTFLTVSKKADPAQLQDKLQEVYKRHTGADETYPFKDTYYLQPLAELHLETIANFDIGLKGNPKYISLFSLVAILVLILAVINYMNLAIARSIRRAREVGLRKVIGARRRQLVVQFIGESVLVAFLALLLALALTYWLSPLFAHLLERPIALNFVDNLYLVPALLALVLIVGVLSGSYPAIFMSALRPVQVLKGKIDGQFSGIKLQRALVIGQYATSIVLIISSLVIYQQFQFIRSKDLGYDREHIVTIPVRDKAVREHFDQLKTEWLKTPQILAITTSLALPTNIDASTIINDEEGDKEGTELQIYQTQIGYGFLDLFGIDLIAGRTFSSDYQTDAEESVVLNETAVKALGWTAEEAIGQQITYSGTETVIGVIKDFHMHSMHMAIEPLMLRLQGQFFRNISVKVLPEDLPATLAVLEAGMKKYSSYPFEYSFLDEQFDELYKADIRLGEMLGFFTLLSIFIASLGLFGMAAFVARQRTKEVGIRKVLGATANNIIALLSGDFLKMVLLGFLLAVPIAWYGMHRWLQDFAYHIELEWWLFAVAGLAAMLLALFTVGAQSLKAVFADPVEALKNE